MPLTNGSGFGSGSWIRILLFSSLTFKMPAKNKFFNTIFSPCDFLKLHLHHLSKIKIQKESQNSRNQGFSYYFCMIIEGSGSRSRAGSESIPLTSESGSGSWRPKNMWIRWIRIRIRIRNTDFNPKKWFLSSRKYDPSCSSRNQDPDADFLPIPDPGSSGQKGNGSRIRIRNTDSE
jgi:hypothetical protein